MRKLFTIGFLAALGLAGSVQAALQDGTYEVSAKGNNGPVVFSVEIQGQAIKSIKVVRGEETPGLGIEAIAMISKEIIARQTTAVDAVSGATNSSRAVTAAVEAALQKAGGTAADLKRRIRPMLRCPPIIRRMYWWWAPAAPAWGLQLQPRKPERRCS